MEEITKNNLTKLKPTHVDIHDTRVAEYQRLIGVEAETDTPDYVAALHKWNEESAIGLTPKELDIIGLILDADKGNLRAGNHHYVHENHRDNTAMHPIFIALEIDRFWDEAGLNAIYEPDYEGGAESALYLATMRQKMAMMALLHDAGELLDISHNDMVEIGASKKEPDNEQDVAIFKFELAAWLLSKDRAGEYPETLEKMQLAAGLAKEEILQTAKDNLALHPEWDANRIRIEGNKAIDLFGERVAQILSEELEEHDTNIQNTLTSEYNTVCKTLLAVYAEAEPEEDTEKSIAARIFTLLDKYESDLHIVNHACRELKNHKPQAKDHTERFVETLFGDRTTRDLVLGDSEQITKSVSYCHKPVAECFDGLNQVPDHSATAADRLLRNISAVAMRYRIPILLQGPHLINLASINGNEHKAPPSKEGRISDDELKNNVWGRLIEQYAMAQKHRPRTQGVRSIGDVIASDELSVVLEQTARAIEDGSYTPTQAGPFVFPTGENTELPKSVRVSHAQRVGIEHDLSSRYPDFGLLGLATR